MKPLDENVKRIIDMIVSTCQKALEANGMKTYVVEDKTQACELVNSLIKDKELVADGGSMTLLETGVMDMLKQRDVTFRSHGDKTMTRAESDEEARRAFFADTFLMSANAISEQGEIFNTDGHGNRVSAMIFGPKQVIILAGYNKIVKDEPAAWERIRTIAAPANCVRLQKQTPCSHVGECRDCHSKDRICSSHVKINYDQEDRLRIILIKEALGY